MKRILATFTLATALILAVSESQAQPKPVADGWINTPYELLATSGNITLSSIQRFEGMRAEAIAGKLRIYWQTGELDTNQTVTVWSSADDSKRIHSRDWRPFPMTVRGRAWETSVPVDNVDVPLAYFVEVRQGTSSARSPFRQCLPRLSGLEEPSRIFWPFLEGFEEDAVSWRMLSDNGSTMSRTSAGKDGKSALTVTLPEGKRSVTIATTRIRGWQIEQQTANGIRIWMRTVQGNARVRFTFHANAFAENQSVVVSPVEPVLTPQWQAIDVPFKSLPPIVLGDIDLVGIEIISIGPAEFQIDNLQLLGRWKLEREK